jgi:hypothetical protein
VLNPHLTVLWDEIICDNCGRIIKHPADVYRLPLRPQYNKFICADCGEEEMRIYLLKLKTLSI